ncbi:hypothetical protein PFISCL1PPCAC_9089 [Pristionchus fissidentatus]|uniref:Poly [ADP-ribose] polymerase n=1 Tax=Pristionchus fissidentatus TaxID=1538716 RepID=A0AAV5VGE7_9BILA|nr:hypothetical protein PFISCL1PPCAC_9089 [Pristionchus fissidentatus]
MGLKAKDGLYDATDLPLGLLSEEQIEEVERALGDVEMFIENEDFGEEYEAAVSEYYSLIPHATGYRTRPPLIDAHKLKEEKKLLKLLKRIAITLEILKEEVPDADIHPLDRHYASLKCRLTSITKQEAEFEMVAEYLRNTHSPEHSFTMELKNVFRIERKGEQVNNMGNRVLLWHGSRVSKFSSILSNGLRVPKDLERVKGHSYGKESELMRTCVIRAWATRNEAGAASF